MKGFVTFHNVHSSIMEKADGIIPAADAKKLAEEAYAYAIMCKQGGTFNEMDTMAMVEKYLPPNTDEAVLKDIWAVVTMYCFENSIFQIVHKYSTGDPESAINNCLATLFECARQFQLGKSKFLTYATTSMINNVRRDNRYRYALKLPDQWIVETQYIRTHPEETDEEIAAYFNLLGRKKRKITSEHVRIIRKAIQAQGVISMDERFEGDSNGDGGTIASILASDEDIVADFVDREAENALRNDFLPTVAHNYGADSAYCVSLRAGVMCGYESMSFYKMEVPYCIYLVTKKKLKELGDAIPKYAELCTYCSYLYAVKGRRGVEEYVKGKPEEYLIENLLNEAVEEADVIVNSPNRSMNECFKPAGSLNYMFSKIFPPKPTTLSDSDRRQAARFRKELRDKGMDEIANALFAMSKASQ